MLTNFIKNIFGTRNSRILKDYQLLVTKINSLEEKYQKFTEQDFIRETENLRLEAKSTDDLSSLIPNAYALVREASIRTLGLRHYDEQLMGGIALHYGKIAEMKTGEGKTLVSTLPAYLNTLKNKSVFIVTVNDYLAERDAEWMGQIFKYLGLSVGTIISSLTPDERKEVYKCNIVYGTNNEFGFDYLRDNMTYDKNHKVQGKLNYAIIDEVDSVLIDEARTPLIISGSAKETGNLYLKINKTTNSLIKKNKDDELFVIDEKQKSVSLTESGHSEIEKMLTSSNLITSGQSLYDPKNIQLLHLIDASLKANLMYHKDIDYVIDNGEIIIIDEFSGRKMPGRRWAEGLHQSVEAKEGVNIQNENQTYASITFQNYFRLFNKLSGMTGTADTEATEFQQIYNLEVVVIPPHRKMIRKDHTDLIYLTSSEKYTAIIHEIQRIHDLQQPVLVGTTSIESSEYISLMLKKEKIKHSVLNAKHHQMEADIIANAGTLGAVTIATNMAGRGTDIVLGGKNIDINNKDDSGSSESIKKLGGLFIIGTERHESRRVDNQLRGRAGRQGDPGESRFFLSLEDNLMRIFASEKVSEIMKKLGMEKGEAIEHKWVSKSIENAQKRVEAHNFDIRKTLLEYDDISNEQRKVIYNQRDEILISNDIDDIYKNILKYTCDDILYKYIPEDIPASEWDLESLDTVLRNDFLIEINSKDILERDDKDNRMFLTNAIKDKINNKAQANMDLLDENDKNELMRNIFLSVIDEDWRNHLNSIDYLRQGVGLRSYAQKNPKNEYKRESFEMFEEMLSINNLEIIKILCKIKINRSEITNNVVEKDSHENNISAKTPKTDDPRCLLKTSDSNVPRNKKCPVTNKKFKQCCGRL